MLNKSFKSFICSCKKVNIWIPFGYFPFLFHFAVEMKYKKDSLSRHWGHGCVFGETYFLKKRHFVCLHLLNRYHLLLFLKKYIFQNSRHQTGYRTQQGPRTGPANSPINEDTRFIVQKGILYSWNNGWEHLFREAPVRIICLKVFLQIAVPWILGTLKILY